MSDGFFVADVPLDVAAGSRVQITDREAHHAAVVRRLKVGEAVTVTAGDGRGVIGAVASIDPGLVEVEVEQVVEEPLRRPAITVVQALPKNDRAELAVDLMTEVGVDRIVPWQAARSIVKWQAERAETSRAKWETAAREASKQARRFSFPVIDPIATTSAVAELVRTCATSLIMHEKESRPLSTLPLAGVEQCLIIIGPEGGLTDQEVELFEACGGQTYSLGSTVLRAATAGCVAIAQVRALWQVRQPGGDHA
ncbi:MAG: 16S rRNA (uracil(1498)-N(3))-methyltransferase [Propionibacteriaceae bacterium]|nr:16S rRNA (uracil(1498)-N(3))-methyltransferase [Propionibacteriaceae bacterium]